MTQPPTRRKSHADRFEREITATAAVVAAIAAAAGHRAHIFVCSSQLGKNFSPGVNPSRVALSLSLSLSNFPSAGQLGTMALNDNSPRTFVLSERYKLTIIQM